MNRQQNRLLKRLLTKFDLSKVHTVDTKGGSKLRYEKSFPKILKSGEVNICVPAIPGQICLTALNLLDGKFHSEDETPSLEITGPNGEKHQWFCRHNYFHNANGSAVVSPIVSIIYIDGKIDRSVELQAFSEFQSFSIRRLEKDYEFVKRIMKEISEYDPAVPFGEGGIDPVSFDPYDEEAVILPPTKFEV